MDLGGSYEIRSISTQGRRGSIEFVTEYIVQFSDDGEAWRSFTDTQGETEVLLCCFINIKFSLFSNRFICLTFG
jgi:hypothetical protein